MTTKLKTRKISAKRAPRGEPKRTISEISRLVARWRWLERPKR